MVAVPSPFRRALSFFTLCFATALIGSGAAVYKGAIVINVDDGHVLFEDNADYVGPPASVTKLMTFLIVKEQIAAGRLSLVTPVTVDREDARMGGTQVWLAENEVFPVEDLLFALMVQSANDAAHALSHAAAGSREAFVALMNERARALGMTHTTWRSPHGLPPSSRKLADSDLTSPRDLAILSRTLLQTTDVLRYTAVERMPFGTPQRDEPVMMDNHNNLVGKIAGVDGLKTGFTRAAGFCLAATAERNGRRVVAVIMGSPTSKERDIKMAELLEIGFARLPTTTRTLNLSEATPLPANPIDLTLPKRDAPPSPPAPAPRTATAEPEELPDDETASGDDEPPTVRFVIP